MWSWIHCFFHQRPILWILFFINFFGSIYGFYWYRYQLEVTEWQWLIFVPDSPTASLAFTGVLLLYLIRKTSPLLEAFAAITLFKYGIWAVVLILLGDWLDSQITWLHWMLILSHIGMALQAWLYVPGYSFGRKELAWVAGWTLLNDALDYGLDIHPWLATKLEPFDHWVGVFTAILSIVTLLLFHLSTRLQREKNPSFDLQV